MTYPTLLVMSMYDKLTNSTEPAFIRFMFFFVIAVGWICSAMQSARRCVPKSLLTKSYTSINFINREVTDSIIRVNCKYTCSHLCLHNTLNQCPIVTEVWCLSTWWLIKSWTQTFHTINPEYMEGKGYENHNRRREHKSSCRPYDWAHHSYQCW